MFADIGQNQSAKIGDFARGRRSTSTPPFPTRSIHLVRLVLTRDSRRKEASLRTNLAKLGHSRGIGRRGMTPTRTSRNRRTTPTTNSPLTGEGQAASESIAQRNQPINENHGALLNGVRRSERRTFNASPTTSVAGHGTVAGHQRQNSYLDANQQAQPRPSPANNATMGGLFSPWAATLGTAAIKYSDSASQDGRENASVPLG